MTFFGKTIPTDRINFVMNCISFVLGIIFFIRMQYKMSGEETRIVNFNSERDSLLMIETKLNLRLNQIQTKQDSLVRSIRQNKKLLSQQKQEINVKRQQLLSTLKNDWKNTTREEQNAYINKIMSNLKEYQK